MKLHANAALSLSQRRADGRGWSSRGGRSRRPPRRPSQRPHRARSGARATAPRASAVCWIAPRRRRGRQSHRRATDRGDRRAAAAAVHRPEIAELLDLPLSTVSGILTRIGMGRLGRLGLEPAERYERERPGELIHIDVKKLGRIQGGAGKRITGGRATPRRARTRRGRRRPRHGRLGLRAHRHRRRHPPGLRRSPPRRESHHRDRLPRAARVAFYARHGITVERVMTDNGSPYRSAVHALACRALGIRHLRTRPRPPPDQRQGRTLHPHHARRLGLRRDLRLQPRTHRRP